MITEKQYNNILKQFFPKWKVYLINKIAKLFKIQMKTKITN